MCSSKNAIKRQCLTVVILNNDAGALLVLFRQASVTHLYRKYEYLPIVLRVQRYSYEHELNETHRIITWQRYQVVMPMINSSCTCHIGISILINYLNCCQIYHRTATLLRSFSTETYGQQTRKRGQGYWYDSTHIGDTTSYLNDNELWFMVIVNKKIRSANECL